MEETRRNIAVGLFVIVGLLALGTLVVIFGRQPTAMIAGGTYPLHIHFEAVADIRPGNLVTVKGITIGRVAEVDLVDPNNFDAGVDVLVSIENRYWLTEGTRAIATEPMLGQGRPPIRIIPGPSGAATLNAGATVDGTIERAIEQIFPPRVVTTFETAAGQIGNAAEDLSPVLRELTKLLEDRSPEQVDAGFYAGNLTSAVARLDASLRHFNEVLGDPEVKSRVRATVENVHAMSERGKVAMTDVETAARDGKALMADARTVLGRIDEAVGNIDRRTADLSRSIRGTLSGADEVLDHLSVIGLQIKEGKGSIGRLVMDGRLYESLLITFRQLGVALEEFQALIQEWREGRVKLGL